MQEKNKIGAWISVIGAITNLILYPLFFLLLYKVLWAAELAKSDASAFGCAMVVKYYYPTYTDLGTLSGAIFVVAAYFYFKDNFKWGYILSTVAVINGLMWSFWPAVPALDTKNPPYHLIIFILNFVYYLIITKSVGELPTSRVLFGMIMGMAMITTFMNGVANTNRIIIYDAAPIYVLGQRLSFLVGIVWMVVIITMLLWPQQEWLKPVALANAILALLAGLPLGIDMSIAKQTFSMFLLGPIFSTIILIVLIIPGWWDKIVKPE